MPSPVIRPGLGVLDSRGHSIGRVKALSDNFLHVDCSMALDYFIPMEEVAKVTEQTVALKVTRQTAANRGWEVRPKG